MTNVQHPELEVPTFTPPAPSNVKAPELVVRLLAAAASIDTPELASTVIAAAFISNVPVVVTSISDELPTIFTPPAPSIVRAPALVVRLLAAAASIDTPELASTVIAAAFISNAPVVVTSISDELPTIFTPVAPSIVRAHSALVVRLLAAPASMDTPEPASTVTPPALALMSTAEEPVPNWLSLLSPQFPDLQ